MLIYSMIRFGVTPEINALSTFIILFSFLINSSQRLNKGNLINNANIENISKSFAQIKAVNNVSLNIKNGEFFALLGLDVVKQHCLE